MRRSRTWVGDSPQLLDPHSPPPPLRRRRRRRRGGEYLAGSCACACACTGCEHACARSPVSAGLCVPLRVYLGMPT